MREIAKKMGTTPTIVEYELRRMGYTPHYDKGKPEPDKLLAEVKKERAQADACTRPKREK
ncbi:MAG: hypothetical protein J6C96_12625 [Oscillospiraceae bacterium]|nr:hypothetical protein [Oscillospiraceae bacterium]